MTNPDNIVRVRARNGGRASVYEANGWAQAYSSGLLEGNGVIQNTSADMNVLVGGSASKPDVVLAENPAGYKIALDLVGQQAIAVTAPASNSRISAIVAYTDDLSLASTEDTVTGSPASCGLIVVNGTAAASPSAPTDTQIRSAITSDGATGSQASYAVIATVEVSSTTTIITDSLITMNVAQIGSDNIDYTTLGGNYSLEEIDTGFTWIDGSHIYKKTISVGNMPNASQKNVPHGITNLGRVVKYEGIVNSSTTIYSSLPHVATNKLYDVQVAITSTSVRLETSNDRTGMTNGYVTIFYTKSS